MDVSKFNPISAGMLTDLVENLQSADFVKVEGSDVITHRWDDEFYVCYIDKDHENIQVVVNHYLRYQQELLNRVEQRAAEIDSNIRIPNDFAEQVMKDTAEALTQVMKGQGEYEGWLLPEAPMVGEDIDPAPGTTCLGLQFAYIIAVEVDEATALRGYVSVWPWQRVPGDKKDTVERIGEEPLSQYFVSLDPKYLKGNDQ